MSDGERALHQYSGTATTAKTLRIRIVTMITGED
jgi:hypothetical protein